ncbi:MAG: hypothetical protein JNL13_04915 [Chitinophagaceae bacterium]|nr:hypothetical protein [Chitinophagaceae bacterium]
MAAGGVFVKVKKAQAILNKWPDADLYNIEDISSEIIEFLIIQYEYERNEAKELVEWGWQDEEQSEFLEQVKLEYLGSGLFKKEYLLD